ncbi:DUF202 domain-containing protein [Nocardioides sp. KC13]|uniref:DUF202 domain-containing protein n=1 Tax=Nocardioides turkmenicus TaxID=2711220 RepID=A0A6M1QSN0_9ACTN|nr:DUF202 domain-containing protein [Nocardioides sp. KC13]
MRHTNSPPLRDPGLQPERTSLAWSRTVLGYLVVATICLKAAPHVGPVGIVSAVAYLTVAVAIACSTATRYDKHVRGMHSERSHPPFRRVVSLSTATAALSVHLLWLLIG